MGLFYAWPSLKNFSVKNLLMTQCLLLSCELLHLLRKLGNIGFKCMPMCTYKKINEFSGGSQINAHLVTSRFDAIKWKTISEDKSWKMF